MNQFNENELILHYQFDENLHEIDANMHNQAEQNILSIINEISKSLDIDVEIDLILNVAGGWRDILKFKLKTDVDKIIFTALYAPIILLLISHFLTSNSKLDDAQISYYQNQAEAAKSQKILNEKQIEYFNKLISNIPSVNNSETVKKIYKKQSELYKVMDNEGHTKSFSVEVRSSENTFSEIATVQRSDFIKFIIEPHEEIEVDENATIEIVSPVLNNNGRIKWKGIYNDSLIDFSMKDKEFREKILKKEIRFESENIMSVVLEIKRKVNDDGDEDSVSYAVTEVLGTEYKDGGYFETKKGTKRREDANQLNLFEKFDVDIKK